MSLTGYKEYLDDNYNMSIFDMALKSDKPWLFHIHEDKVINAKVAENFAYDVKLIVDGNDEEIMPKVQIKCLYPDELTDTIPPLIKTNRKVKKLGMSFIPSAANRYHILNKTLYTLMKEKQGVFFTLLEGETFKGVTKDFSRYEITVSLKSGAPVTILRHSIFNLKDKKGRSLLKTFQKKHKDWQNSELYSDI
jgi:sRNA-binding regulator protein Hfq